MDLDPAVRLARRSISQLWSASTPRAEKHHNMFSKEILRSAWVLFRNEVFPVVPDELVTRWPAICNRPTHASVSPGATPDTSTPSTRWLDSESSHLFMEPHWPFEIKLSG